MCTLDIYTLHIVYQNIKNSLFVIDLGRYFHDKLIVNEVCKFISSLRFGQMKEASVMKYGECVKGA